MLGAVNDRFLLNFANKFLISFNDDNSWPLRILWADETYFMLTDNVNSKNCVHWADNKLHDVFASPLHDEKVTVW